jgi:hypothetical protein
LLPFSNFRFEAKQSEAKFKSIFSLFFTFFIFFAFLSLFFALNFSLRFDLVIFASKRNEGEIFFASKEAKFNIFRIISLPNFVSGEKKRTFLSIFLLNFCFPSIFLLVIPSFLLQIFGVSHRSESCEIRFFHVFSFHVFYAFYFMRR